MNTAAHRLTPFRAVAGATALAVAALTALAWRRRAVRPRGRSGTVPVNDYPACAPEPFAHGVASGDPLEDRVIIWTRVTLPTRDPDGPPGANPAGTAVPVDWELATDPAMGTVVASGSQKAVGRHDWTVKVDVTGLAAGTTYYYRFRTGDAYSMVGRTRTAAGPGVERARFAVLACSSYFSSQWSGLGNLADRDDLDLVVHLGDYVYDFIDKWETVRSRPGFGDLAHPDNRNWRTLDEVRRRYALWRSDPNLVRAHQQHPFFLVWDNHDLSPTPEEDLPVPPVAVPHTVTLEDTMRAFWEWTPSRPPRGDGSGEWLLVDDGSYPVPEDHRYVYRGMSYGDLVDVFGMDAQSGLPRYHLPKDGSHVREPSLLGRRQFEWLTDGVSASQERGTLWKMLCNQAWFSPVAVPDPIRGWAPTKLGVSRWTAFPAEKDLLISHLRENVTNTVMVSGDVHGNLATDILSEDAVARGYASGPLSFNTRDGAEPGNAAAGAVRAGLYGATRRGAAGVEFAPSSMGRGGADDTINGGLPDLLISLGVRAGDLLTSADISGVPSAVFSTGVGHDRQMVVAATRVVEARLAARNPGVQFMEWVDHGYGVVDLDRRRAVFEFWWQDKLTPGSPDVLGHQMITWAEDDASQDPPRYRHQIDAVQLHGLPVEATRGTRSSEPAPAVPLQPR